jgi:hypothetical protein
MALSAYRAKIVQEAFAQGLAHAKFSLELLMLNI